MICSLIDDYYLVDVIMFKILILLPFISTVVHGYPEDSERNCTDFEGASILHGLLYVPGPDMCSLCVCYHGEPMWCKTIFCPGPPTKCRNYTTGLYCCDFKCLDDPPIKNTKKRNPSAASSLHSQNWILFYIILLVISNI